MRRLLVEMVHLQISYISQNIAYYFNIFMILIIRITKIITFNLQNTIGLQMSYLHKAEFGNNLRIKLLIN